MTAPRMGKGAVKKAKLTPWFPADVNPVRVDEYECSRLEHQSRVTRRLHWSGAGWSYSANHPHGAWIGGTACMFVSDKDKWRGLASDPSKGAQ